MSAVKEKIDLKGVNSYLADKSPDEIISWALSVADRPILTTNFRPYAAVILHAVASVKKDVNVIWCDTGYNTRNTYLHAEELIQQLSLNISVYVPKQTTSYRDAVLGIPEADTKEHDIFTEQVKLEPFRRAMNEYSPDVWFANLRKGQTKFRDSIDIVSVDRNGVIKVSPFYYWSDEEMNSYLQENNLPIEHRYFDPTKVLSNRECGLHA